MWVAGANPNTPPSHSWGRFSAHISQIKQKVLKGYIGSGALAELFILWFQGLNCTWNLEKRSKFAYLKFVKIKFKPLLINYFQLRREIQFSAD
jgi:hypothetical protein